MILSLALLGSGMLFCWMALVGWRHRNEERISIIEAGILQVTGEEPLPRTRLDWWLGRFHLFMSTIFGPLLVFLGGYGLLSKIGAL